MLVKRSKTKTNFVLPVWYKTVKLNWYYDCEGDLWKAYYQLKAMNGAFRPSYPVVYSGYYA